MPGMYFPDAAAAAGVEAAPDEPHPSMLAAAIPIAPTAAPF